MPRLFGHEHDVALVGEEDRQRADAVADLPLENEPELRRLEMKVPLSFGLGCCGLPRMMLATARSSAMKRRGIGAGGDGVEVHVRLVARIA